MKLAVFILVVLGLLAAFAAAILVSTLRPSLAGGNGASEIEVVVAGVALPAASVVTSSHVAKGTAPKNDLPTGYLSSPVQAVGKILAVPVVEGQILTKSCFVSEGSGAQLAAAIPEGMRAFAVTLPQHAVTGGLLYAGCVVDILASFRLASSERGQAISTTLLREIQVLAVEGTTVVSRDATEQDVGSQRRSRGGSLTVTLMVDSKQAEALQLAVQHGNISLAMRNPLDKKPVRTDATLLSQGRLATSGSALDPAELIARALHGNPSDANDLVLQAQGAITQEPVPATTAEQGYSSQDAARRRSSWSVTVIRGREMKEQELELREGNTDSE